MGDYADLLTAQDQAAARRATPVARTDGLPFPAKESARPLRRAITRCAFEVYQDQLERLRDLALREKHAGGRGSMSAMVREAIDRRLAQAERAER